MSKAIILNRSAYISNLNETNELQMQVDELIAKGYLRESMRTFMCTSVSCAKKKCLRGCVWIARMCVDCENVNNITVKYRHLILRIYDMLDELHCSYILMKIELKCGYHQIKMKKNDE